MLASRWRDYLPQTADLTESISRPTVWLRCAGPPATLGLGLDSGRPIGKRSDGSRLFPMIGEDVILT